VLMTSISEGLPIAILEAMGQGRPVVTTGVGGVPDVVRGCGVIAAPGDAHALAMGLLTLLRRPGLAWRLGQRGHRRLSRTFSEASCVSGYRDLLDDVAAGRRPRRPAQAADLARLAPPILDREPLAA
jgi:glycosyltransferase involved in cell wall biosynthesis